MKTETKRILNTIIVILSILLVSCGAEDMWSRLQESGTKLHITYNANGGTGAVPVDTAEYVPGDEAIIPGNTGGMTNGVLVFNGWTLSTDGSDEIYTQGETFIFGTGNVTLYARWDSGTTYTIQYFANGGTGDLPVDTTLYLLNQYAVVLDRPVTLTNGAYEFSGWNTDSAGTNVATNFAPGSSILVDSDKHLYAIWILPIMVTEDFNLWADNTYNGLYSGDLALLNTWVTAGVLFIPDGASIESRLFRIPAIIEGYVILKDTQTPGVFNHFCVLRDPPIYNKKNLPTGFYFSTGASISNIMTTVTLLNSDGSTPSYPVEHAAFDDDSSTEYRFKIEMYTNVQSFYINDMMTPVRVTNYNLKSTLWWYLQFLGDDNANGAHLLNSITIQTIQQGIMP